MTVTEFSVEMEMLEACKKMTREQRASRRPRWTALYGMLKRYDIAVWRGARERLMEGGDGYLPCSDDIAECCEEVFEEMKPPVQLVPRFPVAPHTCAKDRPPVNGTAVLIASFNAYEGEHLYCPGEILATCPMCGARHESTGVFEGFFKIRGDSSEGINDRMKGYSLCGNCQKGE